MIRLPYRWELMVWLWLAFFFNQADRQVFSVVLPHLRADLGLTDVQAGLVASVFTIVLGLLAPFAGYAGDTFSRARIVTLSVFGWSLATMFTGFSTGLVYLIVVRVLTSSVFTRPRQCHHQPASCGDARWQPSIKRRYIPVWS